MVATGHNLTIEQGATFSFAAEWQDNAGTPYDLTGYTARLHVRTEPYAVAALLECTTANGRILLGTTDGAIDVRLTATETAALSWGQAAYYDLELVSAAGVVTRLIEGRAMLSPEVTR